MVSTSLCLGRVCTGMHLHSIGCREYFLESHCNIAPRWYSYARENTWGVHFMCVPGEICLDNPLSPNEETNSV